WFSRRSPDAVIFDLSVRWEWKIGDSGCSKEGCQDTSSTESMRRVLVNGSTNLSSVVVLLQSFNTNAETVMPKSLPSILGCLVAGVAVAQRALKTGLSWHSRSTINRKERNAPTGRNV